MTSFDQIAEGLGTLRESAGSPSYAEIALRIARIREERGGPDAHVRPARTTVYDAFRLGRRRLDTALVLDIAQALGADEAELQEWARRCREARRGDAATPVSPPAPPAPEPEPEPEAERALPPSVRAALLVCLGCVGLNLMGRLLVDALPIPLYLDMTGTAVAAVVLGPWWGAGVGLVTNLAGAGISGPASIPFGLVNVVGALAWGYGVRRWRMGATFPRFAALNCLTAVACSLVAVPIVIALGGTDHSAETITAQIQHTVESLWLAVASANILTSLADKTISGFIALLAVDVLPRSVTASMRPLMPLAAAPPAAPRLRSSA